MDRFTVTDIAVKKLKADEDSVTFAIKATVTRNFSGYEGDTNAMIEIQGLDAEDFARTSVCLEGSLAVGQTKTLTAREEYYDGDYGEIVRWEAKL